jgi:hypothetical protein
MPNVTTDPNQLDYLTPPDELEIDLAKDDRWGVTQ